MIQTRSEIKYLWLFIHVLSLQAMKLISLNWMNFELFYVLESIMNILQDSIRFEKIQEYSKSK